MLSAAYPAEEEWWVALGAASVMADYLDIDDREALKEALLRASDGNMEWLPLPSVKTLPPGILWGTPRAPCWSCCWSMLLKARHESSRENPDGILVRAMLEEAWRTCPSTTLASDFVDAVTHEALPPIDELLARTSTLIAAEGALSEEDKENAL